MALNAVVVSDSTTLITLINIRKFEILFKFTDTIIITKAVYSEVSIRVDAKKILDDYVRKSKIRVEKVDDDMQVKILFTRLDLGESESIALAIERNVPLVIDEKRGKNVAKSLGLDTIGLIGILLLYKQKKLLSPKEIKEIVVLLQESNFRVSTILLVMLLE
ncbi:MAG: DUF3368 domain-containing protein [Sulfurovum sp.]|nr:DUF3368 domain-containing protein [Sulfurovum sp.]